MIVASYNNHCNLLKRYISLRFHDHKNGKTIDNTGTGNDEEDDDDGGNIVSNIWDCND